MSAFALFAAISGLGTRWHPCRIVLGQRCSEWHACSRAYGQNLSMPRRAGGKLRVKACRWPFSGFVARVESFWSLLSSVLLFPMGALSSTPVRAVADLVLWEAQRSKPALGIRCGCVRFLRLLRAAEGYSIRFGALMFSRMLKSAERTLARCEVALNPKATESAVGATK